MTGDLVRGLRYAGVGVAMLLGVMPYVRFNMTNSMPLGLWATRGEASTIDRGIAVMVCLPYEVSGLALARRYLVHGECPGDIESVLKTVAAVAGDQVLVSPAGIAVNGQIIPGTVQRAQDSQGREMQVVAAGTYAVAPGTVWLVSNHDPLSFDSRYFGPVPAVNVRGVAYPILVSK